MRKNNIPWTRVASYNVILKTGLTLIAIGLIAACSALPQKDLRKEYFEAARKVGLTPVFPPREEFQVGDVYYFIYDANNENDLSSRQLTWLGTLTSVRQVANDYLRTRTNFADTNLTSSGFDVKPGQDDLITGRVLVNDASRRSLLLASYPSITGAASTAASFGGFGFRRSFGAGIGRAESVSLDFGDTRATGLPRGAVAISGRYENEFRRNVCPRIRNFILGPDPSSFVCPEGLTCQIAIVTNTVVTRKFTYTYSSAAISQLAASSLTNAPQSTSPQTLPLPGNLDVSVTLQDDPDGAALSSLVTSLNNDVATARVPGTESNGLSFVGLQANGLVFDRTFRKPVAIGYEALAGTPQWFNANICRNSHAK